MKIKSTMRPTVIRSLLGIACLSITLRSAELAAEWRFDKAETSSEKSSVGNVPTTINAQQATGTFGEAAYFSENAGEIVSVTDHQAVQFGRNSFSISVWLCPTQLAVEPKGQYRRFLCKSSFPGTFWTLDIYDTGRVMFAMRDDDKHTGTTTSDGTIAENAWTHLSVIVDRETTTTHYFFNGALDSSKAFTKDFQGNLDVPGKDLLVSTWRKYIGLADNLRFYSGALTQPEITAQFTAEHAAYSSSEFKAKPRPAFRYAIPIPTDTRQTMWDLDQLHRIPETYPAPQVAETEKEDEKNDGVRPLFFDGIDYQGKPTRVFAWYGTPGNTDGKLPGMVLVHGGGGTAFRSWVKLWTARGYAAIAMDTCGGIPIRPEGQTRGWQRHDHSGPNGWGDFNGTDKAKADQWTYHAVSTVVLAHTLLRSFPEVDADRTGLTGISWGGYLTNIVVGVDPRFKFASPVYGCGFLGENSAWTGQFQALGKTKGMLWLKLWDLSQYVCYAKLPMLLCNGTNDHFYPMDSWQKTYRTAKGKRTICCRVRMGHSHPPAGDPQEITAFANHILKGEPPLAHITTQGRDGNNVWATYQSQSPITKAELNYTDATGNWEKRKWQTIPAQHLANTAKITATLPETATVYYLNLIDERGYIVSTEHEELKQ